MWIASTIGFFSAVENGKDRSGGTLLVRARVRSDLERLKAQYCPDAGDITESPDRDYRYRMVVDKHDWAVTVGDLAADINYHNFTGAVGVRQGHARAHVYSDVWTALLQLESIDKIERLGNKAKRGKPKAKPTPQPDVIVVRRKAGAWKAETIADVAGEEPRPF